ncbi:DUF5994 family protein [Streptomyces sp. NPDC088810]|uniref:DUF5994 family protein n=1 Tax=Streptomyces sp. NPDC088810 TaxID=3365904 RepID=UPI003829B9B6
MLDPLWGRITRIAVNPKYWPVIPHHIPVDSHVVKAGWFTPEIAQLMVVDVLVVRDERVGDHVQPGTHEPVDHLTHREHDAT